MSVKRVAEQMRFVFADNIYEEGEVFSLWFVLTPEEYRGIEVLTGSHVDPNSDSEEARTTREVLAYEFEKAKWFGDVCWN